MSRIEDMFHSLRGHSSLLGRVPGIAVVLAVAILVSGCGDAAPTRVQLHVRPPNAETPTRLAVEAQVTGPQNDLHYKWFSVSGVCDPQESDAPATTFHFAEDALRDRVSVELWRRNRRVATAEVDVRVDEDLMRLTSGRQASVEVEITLIPPAEPGGPETRAAIAGKVTGRVDPTDKVVLYAYAYDYWHIQPVAQAVVPIGPDNTWSNWTHTGTSYAALVVKDGYEPRMRLDLLPRVGGGVLARAVVEGRK